MNLDDISISREPTADRMDMFESKYPINCFII